AAGKAGRLGAVRPARLAHPALVQCPPMPTKYSRSPWLEQFPKTRIPAYPQQRGTQSVDAVIVGGGLTGCATAYSFAAAGVRVILLEANRIGQGVTAAAGGW